MKFICVKNNLKEALSLVEKISSKNITLPILNNVLISTEKKELKLIATNLEVGIEIKIPAKIEKEGKIAVPTKILYNFLINFSSEENIVIESIQNNLLISVKDSSTIIKGNSIEDFPALPFIEEKGKFLTLPVSDFISGLKSVYYAASLSEMKPEIASVFISSQKNIPLTFVATDSFRLSKKTILYFSSDFFSVLIPYRNAIEIIRIFENEKSEVKIIPNKNQIFFISDKIKFISRLTEGIFPDYNEIIPKKFLTEAIIDKNLFGNNLKTAAIFVGKLNEIKLEINPNEKNIKIQSTHPDLGEYNGNILAEISGEKIKLNFNYKYLTEGIQFVLSDKILLRFNGENKPLLISGTKDNSFYYLVMPMKDI